MASRKGKKRVDSPGLDPAWFDLLANSSRDNEVDEVPPGWLTMKDLAAAWGLSVSYGTQRLRTLVEKGLVETRTFRLQRNTIRPVPHYRIKKG